MSDIRTIENNTPASLSESSVNIIIDRVNETADTLYTTSKEKYERKEKLIEEAKDMSTKEKLDALDQNYDRHNQEVWQNMLIFLALIGIAAGSPTIIRNVRRLVA
ncbi:MAG: hypothetical protein LUG99_14245 [Lachnospiraceae bacterium]|nr:hypothetical protein [Lachnospiraceae bacterium]